MGYSLGWAVVGDGVGASDGASLLFAQNTSVKITTHSCKLRNVATYDGCADGAADGSTDGESVGVKDCGTVGA